MKTLVFALVLLPCAALSQQNSPERFRIYTVPGSSIESFTSLDQKTTFTMPESPIKGHSVFLLDTQTGKTWALSGQIVLQEKGSIVMKYSWEPVYFTPPFENKELLPH